MSEQDSRRELAPVADVLDDVLERFAGPTRAGSIGIFDRWESLAGPEWQRARPVKIDENGVLVVEVIDGGVATRLRFGTDALVAAIAEQVGPGVVSGIRLRVARRRG